MARGVSIVVVEDNREIVEKLRARDVPAVFGTLLAGIVIAIVKLS